MQECVIFFTFMRIKILALTCKRRLQWKKLIEILFGITIYTCTSLNIFWTISASILCRDWKDVCGTHILEQSPILEKKTSKIILSLRKNVFGGTFWWEKLKFSEKSHFKKFSPRPDTYENRLITVQTTRTQLFFLI